MADSHFQRVKELFAAVAAMPAGERASFLEVACAGDTKLRAEVQSLLNAQAPLEESDVVEPISEAPGMRIGPYKLLERIGEGTFGVVFMAEQEEPVRRRVALKVLKLGMDTKQVVARFEQERQALALMEHPNIAKVLDAGATSSGRPFFVMELVRGDPITEYCDREKLPTRDRLAIFVDVCRAVQHAHHKGVIHRDLKPSNVLVTLVDGRPVAKVIDFGVAKALHGPLTARTLFTEFRQMIGTPLYMSPEQAEMSGVDIDTRSDLYSLGVMLYELLTGTTPITREQMVAAGLAELHRTIREVEPPKPSTRLATLGAQGTDIAARRGTEVRRLGLLLRGDLDWIVMKCLEKDRTRRYETPISLVEDLLRHLSGEAVHAAPPSAMYQIQKFVRRKKGLVSASAAVVLTALVGVGAFALKAEDAKNEALAREKAESARAADALAAAAEQKRLKEVADRKATEASEARDRADFESYVANISAAESALRLNEFISLRGHLNACPTSFRRWEWQFLHAESDASLLALRGHGAYVMSAVFSPNGTRVVTASFDRTARVWDAITGKLLCILFGHDGGINSATFSSDETSVLTSSSDHTARVWNAATGALVAVLRGHDGSVTSASFSPDGTLILTGSDDRSARLWSTASWKCIGVLRGHEGSVLCAAFSPDGKRIVTAASDNTARVWDAALGQEIVILRGHENIVTSAGYSSDGMRIVTSSHDKAAHIWDAATGREISTLRGHEAAVNSASFSPDGLRIVTSSQDRSARVWDTQTGQEITLLRGHDDNVSSAFFSPDGTRIVTSSWDRSTRIWSSPTPQEVAVLKGHSSNVNFAAFSPDGARVVTASDDHTARIWDAATGRETAILHGHLLRVSSAVFSPDGTRVLTASLDETARLWDVSTGREIALFRGHSDHTSFAAFDSDGARIVTVSWDKSVRIWDAMTGKLIATLRCDDRILAGILSSDGAHVAVVLDDRTARVWDLGTKAEVSVLRGHEDTITSVAFESDSRLASGPWGVFSASRKAIAGTIAYSPDGSHLLTTSRDQTARIWDRTTGKEVSVLRGHDEQVSSAAYSPDGTCVVTASEDRTARIWDVARGKQIAVLRGHKSAVTYAAFSTDGTRIVTASTDSTARIWHSVPYRERFPQIQVIREAVARAQKRAAQMQAQGSTPASIRDVLLGKSSVTETDRTGIQIALCPMLESEYQIREEMRREASSALESVRVVLIDPASSRDALDLALDQARRAVELTPEDADSIRAVGMAHYRLGALDAALSELLKAEGRHRAANDERPTDWAFLAMTYAKLGRKSDADAALARTRELAGLERFRDNTDVAMVLAEAESVVSEFAGVQRK